MSGRYGGSVLYGEFHSDIVHDGADESFHIRYIAIFQLPDVMCFIVANPSSADGEGADSRLINKIRDTLAQRKPFDLIALVGILVFAIVLDQKLQGLSVADAGDLIKVSTFRLKGLVVDFDKLRR